MVDITAKNSHAKRDKVGCVIVKNGRIVSTGWNGTPSGFNNSCELNGVTIPEVIHAEANALMAAARVGISTEGSTLFVSISPCMECAKLIIQAGITKVVSMDEYRDLGGYNLLGSCDVSTELYIRS